MITRTVADAATEAAERFAEQIMEDMPPGTTVVCTPGVVVGNVASTEDQLTFKVIVNITAEHKQTLEVRVDSNNEVTFKQVSE